jgi:C1A family cysteine protease
MNITIHRNNIKRKFGWLRDKFDSRDLNFSVQFRLPTKLPPSTDLRDKCSPVEDQGELGSCTANALVGALEYLEIKAGVPFQDLSRLFVYYNERDRAGTVGEDSGAQLRDGIKVLAKLGVCKETSWPYDINRFKDKPTDECYLAAGNHQITAYQRMTTLSEMKACLAGGLPFVGGFTVYPSMMTDEVKASGVIPMPSLWDKIKGSLGGHAICFVGYDDVTQTFIVRNSWGAEWGQKGYCFMPYAYVQKYASDFWCIQKNENDLYAMLKQQEVAV